MRKCFADIKEKTSKMNKKEACSYILTYYWYHILGFFSMIALILLFGIHYGINNQKPVFTCVMVNQAADTAKDQQIIKEFSEYADIPQESIIIDSEYNFSYGDFKLEGVNESSYEKFFFQWRNEELDAVILSESFFEYCREMGGQFRNIEKAYSGSFERYMEGEQSPAVILGTDTFTEMIDGRKDEKLLLAFPETGKHETECRAFMEYLCMEKEGGTGDEEIIN